MQTIGFTAPPPPPPPPLFFSFFFFLKTSPKFGVIFDTISVKVRWEQWCRWNCDLRVINARKQAFSVVPKASLWRWKSCVHMRTTSLWGVASKWLVATGQPIWKKIQVRISKDEAPMPLSAVGPLFLSFLLFHLSRVLIGAWRFSLFRSV